MIYNMGKNNIRSAQLLSPFGIGQIINFPGEISMMICGLDLWDQVITNRKITAGHNAVDETILRINEPRLQKLLGVDYFVKPFPYKTSGLTNNELTIPSVRFPKWHHCTNPKCNRMKEIELRSGDERIECLKSDGGCGSKMIPVRFVAACQHGHIQDVPFREWAHNGNVLENSNEHILEYISGTGSGDLGSIYIKCSCGKGKSLAGLMHLMRNDTSVYDSALARIGLNRDEDSEFSVNNPNNNNLKGEYCKGGQPWLGLEGVVNAVYCGGHLQVLIRGGSNVHYSNIISAIYLPETNEDADPMVVRVFDRLTRAQLEEFFSIDKGRMVLPSVLQSQPEVANNLITKEKLIEGVISELNKKINTIAIVSEDEIKQEEYQYILNGRNSENSDFKAIKNSFTYYDHKEFLESYFECVVLVEKLKETRVFTGFSRISPDTSERRQKMDQLSKEAVKWLPAYEVFGEGIFLKFNDEIVTKWREESNDKFTSLHDRYQSAIAARGQIPSNRDVDAVFVMIHTFAHLLIKRLCFNCGYGSSSLRERIYYKNDFENKMTGVLIYTSSGDSEGSMGGLVRQGERDYLAKLVKDSIEDSKWCSADPVCSDIGQSGGQGPNNVNGSACHNCCLLPETSCEEFNSLLDRATVCGTVENPSLGFFSVYE
jgi:hypothetical protein